MVRSKRTRSRLSDVSRAFGFTEPEYSKNYQPPTLLMSWVRWHGPYNSFDEWIEAAEKYHDNERVRLYMALGKKRWFSILDQPKVQYIGLNARDSNLKLHKEMEDKKNSKGKTFGAAFNEFWVGELISDWDKVAKSRSTTEGCDAESVEIDTPNNGLTKNTEKSLIFALKPEQDDKDQFAPPAFSFRIINQVCTNDKHTKRIIRRFQNLIPDYIEYNLDGDEIKKYRLTFEDW